MELLLSEVFTRWDDESDGAPPQTKDDALRFVQILEQRRTGIWLASTLRWGVLALETNHATPQAVVRELKALLHFGCEKESSHD